MRNRATAITFRAYNSKTVRVIFAKDVPRTGARLKVDLKSAIAAYIPGSFSKSDPSYLVFDTAPDEGTIAHECSHAIRALFILLGVRTDDENFAYHLDFLVGRVHKFLKR